MSKNQGFNKNCLTTGYFCDREMTTTTTNKNNNNIVKLITLVCNKDFLVMSLKKKEGWGEGGGGVFNKIA